MNFNPVGKYNFSLFKGDLIGGISVAAISLPIGVALAEIIKLPPESGIYTAIFALICYFVLGSSKKVIIGPDSATATLLATAIISIAAGNSAINMQLVVLITITTGLLMFLCGLLRLGFIANFLSKPILVGYMNGISVCLIISQLANFTGVDLKTGNSFMGVWELITKIELINLPTVVLGMISLIVLWGLNKISIKIPAQLLLLIISVVCVVIFNLDSFGIGLTQEIKNAYPDFVLPNFNVYFNHLSEILIASAAIVFVSYTGEIPVGRTYSKEKNSFNPNREFFALGLADIVIGLFRGFPISGADSRTAVNNAVGGKTKMVNLIAAFVMVLVIIFLSKQFSLVPSVVFAAIIVYAAFGLFQIKDLVNIRKFSKKEYRVAMICMIGVIFMGVYQGFLLAFVLTIIQLLRRLSKPPENELVYDKEHEYTLELDEGNNRLEIDDILIYRFNSALLFLNIDYFSEKIQERTLNKPNVKTIIIDARTINYIDVTALGSLADIIKEFNDNKIKVVFAGLKERYHAVLSEKLKNRNTDNVEYFLNIRSYFIEKRK